MLVSIILLHYSEKIQPPFRIEQFFQSLETSLPKSSDYELLVLADNDIAVHYKNRLKFFQVKPERVHVELNPIIEASCGEILIKMHSDITFETEGWLQKIVAFFDIAPQNVGIIGPKQLHSKGVTFSYGGWIIHPKGYHPIGYFMPQNMFTQPVECDVVSDAFLVFKRKVFREIEGFDSTLEGFAQTVDFILRARMRGYRVMAVPQVEYIHWYTLKNRRHLSDLTELPGSNRKLFQEKWGFDYLHADLRNVINKYKGTNLLWNMRWLEPPHYDKYETSGALHWDAYFNQASRKEIERVKFVTSLVDKDKCLRILDLGCGDGLHSHFLSLQGHQVVGVDNNPEGLRWAVKKTAECSYPNIPPSFQLANCSELPFHDSSFDCVFCFDLIEHLINPISMLSEVRRVLTPNGSLFLVTPRKLFHEMHDRAHHVVEYEPYELDSLVRYIFGNCRTNLLDRWDLFCLAHRKEKPESPKQRAGRCCEGY